MDEAPQSTQSPAEVIDSQNNEPAGISSQTVAVAAAGEAVSSAPMPAADDLTLASNGGISTYGIVGSAAAGLVVLASATLLAVWLRRREG